MSASHEKLENGKDVEIIIKERFDYSLSLVFRDACRHNTAYEGSNYHVDLSAASYTDNSTLGMLLLLR